jgi:hypothetical protein
MKCIFLRFKKLIILPPSARGLAAEQGVARKHIVDVKARRREARVVRHDLEHGADREPCVVARGVARDAHHGALLAQPQNLELGMADQQS